VLNNAGVTGSYTSSEGLTGDAVWGTRGKWTMLSGTVGSEPVMIAMLDHPSNPTYPTYWHARGYGLFSANVFGRKVFEDSEPEFVLTLEPGKSVTLRHQVLILNGPPDTAAVERAHQAFAASSATTSR
jgi:Methane oxygenase PmoA